MRVVAPDINFDMDAVRYLLSADSDMSVISIAFSEELEKIAKRVSVDELLNRLRARDAARRGVPFTPTPVAPPAVTAPWIREMRALDAALPNNRVGETAAIKRVLPRARRVFISRGLNQRGPAAVAPRLETLTNPTLVQPAAAARASARVDPAAPTLINVDPAAPTLINQVSSPPPVASPAPAAQTGAPRRARMSRGRQATSAAPTQPVAGAPTQPVAGAPAQPAAGAPAAGDVGGLSNWYNNLSEGQRTALMSGGLAAGTGLAGFGSGYLLGDR